MSASKPRRKREGAKVPDDAPLLPLFARYLQYYAEGKGHTARAKRLDLRRFETFLATYHGYSTAEKLKVADWNVASVQSFVETLRQQGEAPATVARRLATVKHMGRVCEERWSEFRNPAKEVRAAPAERAPKTVAPDELSSIEAKALQRVAEKQSFIRVRNRALLRLLLDTGLRPEEARLLRRSQVDDSLQWIEGVRTKGGRYRNIPISPGCRSELRGYLAARERELLRFYEELPSSTDRLLPFFVSSYAASPAKPESFLMGTKTIWRAIHECSAETRLHPHLLRHSYAARLLEGSIDVRSAAETLGHSDVRMTLRYRRSDNGGA